MKSHFLVINDKVEVNRFIHNNKLLDKFIELIILDRFI